MGFGLLLVQVHAKSGLVKLKSTSFKTKSGYHWKTNTLETAWSCPRGTRESQIRFLKWGSESLDVASVDKGCGKDDGKADRICQLHVTGFPILANNTRGDPVGWHLNFAKTNDKDDWKTAMENHLLLGEQYLLATIQTSAKMFNPEARIGNMQTIKDVTFKLYERYPNPSFVCFNPDSSLFRQINLRRVVDLTPHHIQVDDWDGLVWYIGEEKDVDDDLENMCLLLQQRTCGDAIPVPPYLGRRRRRRLIEYLGD